MIAIKRMSKVRFRKDMDITTLAQREYERNSKKRRARRNARMEGRIQESNPDPQVHQPPPAQQLTDWHDYKAVSHKFDCLDYLIEMHGRIMGISLSPCHRYCGSKKKRVMLV